MPDISNDILISASQGDVRSFEAIYKITAGFVYNVAYRIVNNREDAQEVTQEVFLIIYRKLKDFRFDSSFKTWVYRVTANCAVNFAKKTSKTKNKTVQYDDALIAGSVFNEAEEHIDREHHAKTVDELLKAVNPEQRACVVLRNMEGMSYQKIAETLNVNINTVRSRLKRAREKMLAFKKEVVYGQM